MKRILWAGAFALAIGGQALAADLPPPPPAPRAPATYVPVAAPVYNWSGIYIGVNGGYGFGTSNWSQPAFGSTGNFNTNGWLGGGTVGANYQFWGGAVLGVEGDWDWTNLNGTSTAAVCTGPVVPGGPAATGCKTASDWLGTVRGRAGWAFDRVLLYGTGGVAFAPVQATAVGTGLGTDSNTEVGWTAGAGLEFAFAPNWTAKAEYLYVDLSNGSCVAACGGASPPVSVKFTENVIRAGVNFKFNPW
jgi:outer membrane immunogenic protein